MVDEQEGEEVDCGWKDTDLEKIPWQIVNHPVYDGKVYWIDKALVSSDRNRILVYINRIENKIGSEVYEDVALVHEWKLDKHGWVRVSEGTY